MPSTLDETFNQREVIPSIYSAHELLCASIKQHVANFMRRLLLNQISITFVRFLPTERQSRAKATRIVGDGATGVAEVGGGAVRATGNGTSIKQSNRCWP